MKHEEILKNIIPELRADNTISAVMLMGSVAAGCEYPTSDIDLFLLGNKNKFQTDSVDGIQVECLYITYETAKARLDRSGMEVYHYLGSKIIYDLDGRLLKLIRNAMIKYSNYRVSERERIELKHYLCSVKVKLNASIRQGDCLKTEFLTATVSWKIIEAVFYINEIPLPPTSTIMRELRKLKNIPDNDWFDNLFSKDTQIRLNTMLTIIDWAVPLL